MKLVLGTRGSPLARAQTDLTKAALLRLHEGLEVEVKIVKTEGDKDRVSPIGNLGTGAFTKELEDALLGNDIDLAVHSLKDLPTEIAPGLALAAVLPRADWRDALCSRGRKTLAQLPDRARVGTSSPRRRAQLLHVRPDLRLEEIRGNVDTRLKRLDLDPKDDRALDAVVLARAGLDRLGRSAVVAETLEGSVSLPAPGQAAIGLEARSGDGATLELARGIDDAPTHRATDAERLLHRLLGGGCRAPVGALATVEKDGSLTLEAAVGALDGTRLIRARGVGATPDEAARAVFAVLSSRGALEVLATARGASS